MDFLYNKDYRFNFRDYGILIPIKPSRYVKSYQHLLNNPHLNQKQLIPFKGLQITQKDVLAVHQKEYVDRLFGEELHTELEKIYELFDAQGKPNRYKPQEAIYPLEQIFDKILLMASGTYQCSLNALAGRNTFFFGGGLHHGHYDHGSGFCPINDIVICSQKLLEEKKANRIWVIDVDAHKGDGTAALAHKNDKIITFSIHMAEGWPLDNPNLEDIDPVLIPSDVEIGINIGEEDQYLPRLRKGLESLKNFGKADLAIIVQGSDPYEKDELPSTGLLNLTLEQMLERDIIVTEFLDSLSVPRVHLMAGGYGESSWKVYAQYFDYILSLKE